MADVKKIATRESYGNALAELGKEAADLVVLDADLAGATKIHGRLHHIVFCHQPWHFISPMSSPDVAEDAGMIPNSRLRRQIRQLSALSQ